MGQTFSKAMEETLGVTVATAGFKVTPPLISEGDYCVFVKRYNEKIALYIKCTDNQAQGGDVVIALWIAPVEFPDDRIEVLNIGFKIVVYSDYEVSDEIIYSVGQKLVELSSNIELSPCTPKSGFNMFGSFFDFDGGDDDIRNKIKQYYERIPSSIIPIAKMEKEILYVLVLRIATLIKFIFGITKMN